MKTVKPLQESVQSSPQLKGVLYLLTGGFWLLHTSASRNSATARLTRRLRLRQ